MSPSKLLLAVASKHAVNWQIFADLPTFSIQIQAVTNPAFIFMERADADCPGQPRKDDEARAAVSDPWWLFFRRIHSLGEQQGVNREHTY